MDSDAEDTDRDGEHGTFSAAGRALPAKAREGARAYDDIAPSVMGEEGVAEPLAASMLRSRQGDPPIGLFPGLATRLIHQVERGQLDAPLISRTSVAPARLVWHEIAEERLVLIASERTRTRPSDPNELLRAKPFIRFSREAAVGGIIEGWRQARGVTVFESLELVSLEAISSMVFADLGVSIVPEPRVVATSAPPPRRSPLGPDEPRRRFGGLRRKDTAMTRPIEVVVAAPRRAVEIGEFSARIIAEGARA